MNNPLGVSLSTGNQGTTLGKEKNLLTSVGPRKKSFDLGGTSEKIFSPRWDLGKNLFTSVGVEPTVSKFQAKMGL